MRTSQFYHIEAFLDALTNANEDGRILVIKNGKCMNVKLHFFAGMAERLTQFLSQLPIQSV